MMPKDWGSEEMEEAVSFVNYYNMSIWNKCAWNCTKEQFDKLNKPIFQDIMFSCFSRFNKLVPVMNSYVGIQQCQDQINRATWEEQFKKGAYQDDTTK